MKKALVLYHSLYGNTKKVAMSISRGLESGGFYVDCKSINDVDVKDLYHYDVIGIGGPTHFHGVSKQMKSYLKKTKGLGLENKDGFTFETKGDFKMAGSASKRIKRYLKKMKLRIIHPTISGIVLDKEGPLEDNTLELMEQVGINISEVVR